MTPDRRLQQVDGVIIERVFLKFHTVSSSKSYEVEDIIWEKLGTQLDGILKSSHISHQSLQLQHKLSCTLEEAQRSIPQQRDLRIAFADTHQRLIS